VLGAKKGVLKNYLLVAKKQVSIMLKLIKNLPNVSNLTATIVFVMITTVKDTVKNVRLEAALATVFLNEVFQKGALKMCRLAKKVPVMKLIQNFLWLTVLTMEVGLEITRIINIISTTVLHVHVSTIFAAINVPNV